MQVEERSGKTTARTLVLAMALLTDGCGIAPPPEYMVTYAAKGTRSGMSITVSTPNGTEQHRVGASYVSPPYKFKAGQHGYISAQNLGERGTITVMLVYSRPELNPVKLESTSTGGASIATVSWRVGDERPPSGFPQ